MTEQEMKSIFDEFKVIHTDNEFKLHLQARVRSYLIGKLSETSNAPSLLDILGFLKAHSIIYKYTIQSYVAVMTASIFRSCNPQEKPVMIEWNFAKL